MAYYDDIVHYLTDGYWEWAGVSRRKFDVAPNGTLTVNIDGLTEDGQSLAIYALEAWRHITGINFSYVSHNQADIMFYDHLEDARSWSTVSNGIIDQSFVNVSVDWLEADLGYALQTYIHEVGHALGLGHPGPYNFDKPENYFVETISYHDSWHLSVMSYIDQSENLILQREKAIVITPMLADIVAIHNLYGVPESVNGGNTTYLVDSNTDSLIMNDFFDAWTKDPDPSSVRLFSFTLYDTGGNDTINANTDRSDQFIDLNPGATSSVYGADNNLVIAQDTIIENVFAGSGNDVIFGNDTHNRLHGGFGDDLIFGDRGNDLIWGYYGDDWLRGDRGNDTLVGGPGNDYLVGGLGNDRFYFTKDGIYTTDTIFDFRSGQDTIDLRAFETIDSVYDIGYYWTDATKTSSFLDLTDHGGGTIILDDFTDSISDQDFLFA